MIVVLGHGFGSHGGVGGFASYLGYYRSFPPLLRVDLPFMWSYATDVPV